MSLPRLGKYAEMLSRAGELEQKLGSSCLRLNAGQYPLGIVECSIVDAIENPWFVDMPLSRSLKRSRLHKTNFIEPLLKSVISLRRKISRL
ncbi:hypothetical protein Tco_0488694 [Tanacetum coccineum]